jgi:hypothetical protein
MVTYLRILAAVYGFAALLVAIFVVVILISSCAKSGEEETKQKEGLARQQAIRDFYCDELTDESIEKVCDRATFANLANAFCPDKPYDLSRFEWNPGEYHRDFKPHACYPNESKSECSHDMFITKAHDWLSRGDFGAVKEINDLLSYADKHGGKCGEGHSSLTEITTLKPLIYDVREHITSLAPSKELLLGEAEGLPIATHNKYLATLMMYANARMNGEINATEKAALKLFIRDDEGSPIFLGMFYRYHDGDQQRALDAMEADFPSDALCQSTSYRGWGSAPCSIMQILATAILEGR